MIRSKRRVGRPRNHEADQAILRAAVELFIECGVQGSSIERIARRAGVTRATVYRRWPTKEALLIEALKQYREQALRSSGPAVGMTLDKIVQWLVEVVPEVLAVPQSRILLARLAGSLPELPELMAIYWKTGVAPRRAAFVQALDQAREQGRLARDMDAEMLLDMLGGALLYRMLVYPDQASEADLRDYVQRLLRQLDLIPSSPGPAAHYSSVHSPAIGEGE